MKFTPLLAGWITFPWGIAAGFALAMSPSAACAQNPESQLLVDVSTPGPEVAAIGRGQQIEEFNYQFQGGLYAQLIQNPSFEELKNPVAAWSLVAKGASQGALAGQTLADTTMLNACQQHCLKLSIHSVAGGPVGVANEGYWGMAINSYTTYNASFWVKKSAAYQGFVQLALESSDGRTLAQSYKFKPTTEWQHFTGRLRTAHVPQDTAGNRLVIYGTGVGDLFFDVVTLMPPTWKDRPNGVRIDLAERLDALKLKFLQFPGGCTAESYSMTQCWNWKNSVGPLELRAGATRNRWGYKNDLYFGLDEYFQLCEDLGAEPIYVTSAGISEHPGEKDWYGVCPLDQMQPIINDILDLIEYCNGAETTRWGSQRAANGHPKPYRLRNLEIGNENGWQTVQDYRPRYALIRDAIRARYPEMKIMFNATGVPSPTPENYLDYADDHFYEKDLSRYYHKYDTVNPALHKICVAEYASSIHGNGGNVLGNYGDALNDAVFMLGCEKNSERLWWTGYGNYAGLMGHGNFGPCLVWNDAVTNFVTPAYFAQKMLFVDNAGTRLVPFTATSTNCYWSTSLDTAEGRNDLLIKVANKSGVAETVTIQIKGVPRVVSQGVLATMSAPLEAENSLAEPNRVTPVRRVFAASEHFRQEIAGSSINVIRLHLRKSGGSRRPSYAD